MYPPYSFASQPNLLLPLPSTKHSLPLLTLFRKKEPETLICSHRTTVTFWPDRICLAKTEASRPRRWPFPSTTTTPGVDILLRFSWGVRLKEKGECQNQRRRAANFWKSIKSRGTNLLGRSAAVNFRFLSRGWLALLCQFGLCWRFEDLKICYCFSLFINVDPQQGEHLKRNGGQW